MLQLFLSAPHPAQIVLPLRRRRRVHLDEAQRGLVGSVVSHLRAGGGERAKEKEREGSGVAAEEKSSSSTSSRSTSTKGHLGVLQVGAFLVRYSAPRQSTAPSTQSPSRLARTQTLLGTLP